MNKAILFLGPPGSGKGTQAGLFSKKLGYTHIDTARAAREYSEVFTGTSGYVEECLLEGRLIKDHTMMDILRWKLEACVGPLVIDSLPRTLPQARFVVDELRQKYDIYIVVLECGDDECIARNQAARAEALRGGTIPPLDTGQFRKRLRSFRRRQPSVQSWIISPSGLGPRKMFFLWAGLTPEQIFEELTLAVESKGGKFNIP